MEREIKAVFDVTASDRLKRLVETYCVKHRHPELMPFEVHPVQFAMRHETEGGWWASANSALPGCYVLYDASGEALYVGKSSVFVGKRLADHERKAAWKDEIAYVQTISVPEPFEAPALEEFLLREFPTRHNQNSVKTA